VRFSPSLVILVIAAPVACQAQSWEVGAAGGYGWYENPSISIPAGSTQAGFPPRAAFSVVLGNNMYNYLGGELRYMFRFGGPELNSGDVRADRNGYTNVIVYDLLVHLRPRDVHLRPYFAGGAGIKVFSATGISQVNQPLNGFARLIEHTEVEPAISAGVGLKYRFTKHAQFRVDFRTYFSPLPKDIFRSPSAAVIHGWVYDFVPIAGFSYVF
jgi:hypothetical protein